MNMFAPAFNVLLLGACKQSSEDYLLSIKQQCQFPTKVPHLLLRGDALLDIPFL